MKIKRVNEYVYSIIRRLYAYLKNKRLVTKKYKFCNRSQGAKNLLIVIAGFQDYYWDAVFERVKQNEEMFNEQVDVCICVPGADGTKLKGFAEKYKWSYLRIDQDLLAQVQNLAIVLHPNAEWIFKIDEDILLSDNYFKKMKTSFINAENINNKKIGFAGPLINLNAAGVDCFLNTLDIKDQFVEKFGELKIGLEEPIHKSAEVAEWIWSKCIPFDDIASKISVLNDGKYFESNIRFSVGAILFKRRFWDEMNGFVVESEGIMAAEEEQMNAFCINRMYSILIFEDTFVGHMGFWSQKNVCHEFYKNHQLDIRLK